MIEYLEKYLSAMLIWFDLLNFFFFHISHMNIFCWEYRQLNIKNILFSYFKMNRNAVLAILSGGI